MRGMTNWAYICSRWQRIRTSAKCVQGGGDLVEADIEVHGHWWRRQKIAHGLPKTREDQIALEEDMGERLADQMDLGDGDYQFCRAA